MPGSYLDEDLGFPGQVSQTGAPVAFGAQFRDSNSAPASRTPGVDKDSEETIEIVNFTLLVSAQVLLTPPEQSLECPARSRALGIHRHDSILRQHNAGSRLLKC